MRVLHLIAFALLLSAAPSEARRRSEGTVSLAPGESVTVAIDDGGRVHETARGPAPRLSPFEAAAVWNLTNGVYGNAIGPISAPIQVGEDGVPEPQPIAPGVVAIKLVSLGADSTLLVVENGYARGLAYRATMHVSGRARPTDVCEVMPGRFSFEHWPEPIARIDLSRLHLVRWVEGQTPVCE